MSETNIYLVQENHGDYYSDWQPIKAFLREEDAEKFVFDREYAKREYQKLMNQYQEEIDKFNTENFPTETPGSKPKRSSYENQGQFDEALSLYKENRRKFKEAHDQHIQKWMKFNSDLRKRIFGDPEIYEPEAHREFQIVPVLLEGGEADNVYFVHN